MTKGQDPDINSKCSVMFQQIGLDLCEWPLGCECPGTRSVNPRQRPVWTQRQSWTWGLLKHCHEDANFPLSSYTSILIRGEGWGWLWGDGQGKSGHFPKKACFKPKKATQIPQTQSAATGTQETAVDAPTQHEFEYMKYRLWMFDLAMKNKWDDN